MKLSKWLHNSWPTLLPISCPSPPASKACRAWIKSWRNVYNRAPCRSRPGFANHWRNTQVRGRPTSRCRWTTTERQRDSRERLRERSPQCGRLWTQKTGGGGAVVACSTRNRLIVGIMSSNPATATENNVTIVGIMQLTPPNGVFQLSEQYRGLCIKVNLWSNKKLAHFLTGKIVCLNKMV